ncbi:MAG: alpha/beta hydrolase [Candidatus Omnitrophota bacterium]
MKNFLVVLGTLVFLFLYVRFLERRSLYVPFGEITETPKSRGMDFQDMSLVTPDHETLNAWFVPVAGASQTVLFFHGNGGNISHRLEKIALLHALGLNVFIVDYRGYGKSTGKPSENGLYTDAQMTYEHAVGVLKIPADRIVLYGESLGAAVAVELASRRPVAALILEGAFTNIRDMTRWVMPLAPTVFVSVKYDSLAKIKKLRVPILFIHSRNDEIVPFRFGQTLFEAAVAPKVFLSITGGHNDAFFQEQDKIKVAIEHFLSTSQEVS